jgi:hypothetical protein
VALRFAIDLLSVLPLLIFNRRELKDAQRVCIMINTLQMRLIVETTDCFHVKPQTWDGNNTDHSLAWGASYVHGGS